jgi:hypothetical protein
METLFYNYSFKPWTGMSKVALVPSTTLETCEESSTMVFTCDVMKNLTQRGTVLYYVLEKC